MVDSCTHPDWGWNPQPTCVPVPGTEPTTFQCMGQCFHQLSHLTRAHCVTHLRMGTEAQILAATDPYDEVHTPGEKTEAPREQVFLSKPKSAASRTHTRRHGASCLSGRLCVVASVIFNVCVHQCEDVHLCVCNRKGHK